VFREKGKTERQIAPQLNLLQDGL